MMGNIENWTFFILLQDFVSSSRGKGGLSNSWTICLLLNFLEHVILKFSSLLPCLESVCWATLLELINYFAMIGLLGWFSWMSWLFGSPYVRCYPFLLFLDVHWEICECFCLSPSDILGFCSLFHFAQECKRLSMGGFDVPSFSSIS